MLAAVTESIFCELLLEQPIGTDGRFKRYAFTHLVGGEQMTIAGPYTDGARWHGDVHAFPFDTAREAWEYALKNTWAIT